VADQRPAADPRPAGDAAGGGRAPRRDAGWLAAGWLLATVALMLLAGYPLAQLFVAAFGADAGAALDGLRSGRTAQAVWNTLWLSALVTVVTLALATAAALATERTSVPGRRWLRLGLVLPLLLPPYVSALSWARAYGPAGLSERLLGIAVPGVFGPFGVVAVITVNALPLAYVIIAAALATRAEPDLERAARASGAGALEAFRAVTLPLLRPALVAGGALVFVTTANNFGVPAILGRPAGFATVTTRIYEDLVLSADLVAFSRVLVLASLLVAVALVVVLVTDALVGLHLRGARTGLPAGGAGAARRQWWPALAVGGYLLVAVAAPLAALVLVALTQALGLPPVPAHWTLANFGAALDPAARAAAANSLRLAAAAAVTVALLGGLLAGLRGRRAGRAVGSASILTFAVPGSALAVAVLLAYGRALRDTLTLIGIAYVAKLWALGHRTIAAAADAVPADLPRAARASGAGPVTTVRTIVAPLLRPAVAAAALVAFLFALHELTMSALLYGPGTQTLAVVILNLHQLGDVKASSALAVLLTAVLLAGAAPLVLAQRLLRRRSAAVEP
jgi:iron(III) transport system permease protein